jgi:hypothetical protein
MRREWLRPDWDPGLTLAHLPLEPLLGRGIKLCCLMLIARFCQGAMWPCLPPFFTGLNLLNAIRTLHLISNNPSRQRIQAVAEQLGIEFTSGAAKPRRGAIRRVIQSWISSRSRSPWLAIVCSPMCWLETGLVSIRFWSDLCVKTEPLVVTIAFKCWRGNSPDGLEQATHEPAGGESWNQFAAQGGPSQHG